MEKRKLPDCMNIGFLATSLSPVPDYLLQVQIESVKSIWLRSDYEADFFLWLDQEERIIKIQVHILGSILEWNLLEGVRTGIFYLESGSEEKIVFDDDISQVTLEQGLEFVKEVRVLNPVLKDETICYLSHRGEFGLEQEELVKRYMR